IKTQQVWEEIPIINLNSIKNNFNENSNYVSELDTLIPELKYVRLNYDVAGELMTGNRDTIKETLLHTQEGKIVGNIIKKPHVFNYGHYRDLDTPLNITDFNLHFTGTLNIEYYNVFNISRDFVTIKGSVINRDYSRESKRKRIFYHRDCFRNTLEDITAYNPKRDYVNETVYLEGYVFETNSTLDFNLINFNGSTRHVFQAPGRQIETWGIMGGNNDKNVYIEKSDLSRIDFHPPANNLTVK